MKTLLTIALILITACTTTPDWNTGAGCWRYGVAENGNTGRMTTKPLSDIPVVKLGYDELLDACGVDAIDLAWHNQNELQIRACYHIEDETIYSYRLNFGDWFYNHEACHLALGRLHNSCNGNGYGIGNDESACNWDKET